MGIVKIHQSQFEVDCIVFDKDGTLIDFDALWGPRTLRWIDAITVSLEFSDDIKRRLFSLLGYSPENNSIRAESPLAVASLDTLYTIVAAEVCQNGISWHEARDRTMACAQETILGAINPQEIQTKGDIKKVLYQLSQANICIAVVTSDDRSMTEAALDILGISALVDIVICGDDPIPNKPAPDALWLIAEQLGIETGCIMMVGDTLSDMQFASNAGAGVRIGVAAASGGAISLVEQADLIISLIDEIQTL